jgi:hypothetical protein
MHQRIERRGLPPAPLKFWSSSRKSRPANNILDSGKQGFSREQVGLRKLPLTRQVVDLRQLGLSLEEIALEVGATRLANHLLQVLSHNEKLELRVPT